MTICRYFINDNLFWKAGADMAAAEAALALAAVEMDSVSQGMSHSGLYEDLQSSGRNPTIDLAVEADPQAVAVAGIENMSQLQLEW